MKRLGKYILLSSYDVTHFSNSQMFPDFHINYDLTFPDVACQEYSSEMYHNVQDIPFSVGILHRTPAY